MAENTLGKFGMNVPVVGLIYSHKFPDIRDIKRFFPHIGYGGKIEEKSSLF